MEAAILVKRFRTRMFDEVEPFRWANDEILDYLSDAQFEYLRNIGGVREVGTALTAIKLKPGQRVYKLSPRITEVHRVYLRGENLELSRYNAGQIPPSVTSTTGTPRGYYLDGADGSMCLTSIPAQVDVLEVEVSRTAGMLESLTDELNIIDDHALGLIHHAMELAYLKDDVETFDPKRSAEFGQRWREFLRNAQIDVSRRRKTRGTVMYGGL